MTFQEAAKVLALLADGKYQALRYELTTTCSGGQIAECSVYVDGQAWHAEPTWDMALDSLRRAMTKPAPDASEQPEGNDQ